MKKIILLSLFLFSKLMAQDLHIQAKELPCVNKNFNLMIHIVLDSFRKQGIDVATIQQSIEEMNKYFAPICVSFSICDVSIIQNYSFDSLPTPKRRVELLDKHQKFNVFNVFYVDYILQPEICGLSGGSVLIRKDCPGAITHEFGHNFGLGHTFEGGGELVDGSNCDTEGDGICDTPADPYVPFEKKSEYIEACEFISLKKDAKGQYYQPDVGNIMSYYHCDCGFTREQYLNMSRTILSSYLNLW
ncbi:MAG: hypothetical protein KAX53_04245 [Saprospiraceae bacterium]|nr:hypothetical protein [Saprospiraceae bacterium]